MQARAFFLLLAALLLAACGALPFRAQPSAEAPTDTPWVTGTPAPLFAPLNADCAAAGALSSDGSSDGAFPPQLDGVRYGINVFLFATDMERVLTLTNIGGYRWIRQQIHWRDLEGEQGQYVWKPLDQIVSAARAHDVQIMLSVVRSPAWATAEGHSGLPDDPATLAAFLHEVATRYRGRVAAYQVWNEPNLAHENGGTPADPAHYLDVLQAAYPAIKEADPCALVVSAALAATNNPDPAVAAEDIPFYEELYTLEDGAFLRAADIVALHTGAGPHPPDARWPAASPELSHHYFRHLERVRALMQQHDDPRQAWLTEYGWTVTSAEGAPQPVSEQQQATYLVDALWRVRQRYPWISGVFVWNLNFPVITEPDDEKATFGILSADWAIRPAFLALQHDVPALRAADQPLLVPASASHRHTWTFPGRGAMRSAPLLAAGGSGAADTTIYAVSDPGTLYALAPDGRLRWLFNAAGSVTAAPVRAPDGTLYFGNTGSQINAVHADGSEAWTVQLDSMARGSPAYLDGLVVVVTRVGTVLAFDQAGEQVWSYDLEAEATPPAVSRDGALLVVDATGMVSKLDPAGRAVWRVRHAGEYWTPPVPDTTGGAYLVTVAGRVLALDADGQRRWQTDLAAPVVAAPLLSSNGQRLFVAARDGTLTALDTTTGRRIWQSDLASQLDAPPVQGPAGTLYLGTRDERLLAIDTSGTLRWQVQLAGAITAPPALAPAGTLYVGTTGGRLYALEPR